MEYFLGQILLVGFNYAPPNFALCQGQLLDMKNNEALFSLLGTQFGGDGKNNFALPDLRGQIPLGPGQNNASPKTYFMGETGGSEKTALTLNNFPAEMGFGRLSSLVPIPAGGKSTDPMVAPSGFFGTRETPLDNMQPYLVLNYIICTTGFWPVRS